MDYMQLLVQRMGIQIAHHFTPNWSASLDAIRKGECDFLLGAVKTPERETFLDFTQPYYDAVHILIAKKDKPFIASLNALAGQTICGAKNSVMMQKISRDFPSIKQIGIETTEEAIKKLQTGQADACVGSLDQVATELGWFFQDSKIIAKLDYPYPISIAVRKDLPELRSAFNLGIDSLTDTDRAQIMRRWSFVNIEEKVDYAVVWKTIMASCILLGVLFIWNRSLQKEISKRKKAEAAKQSFISMVSHELRTPLNAIMGMLRRLGHTELTENQTAYAKKISYSSEQLLRLINDLLDFQKLETGKFETHYEPFKFDAVINHVVDIVRVETSERNIGLRVSIDKNVPTYLIGDELRLKQILLNLSNNATKFTEHGGIEIIVKCKKKEASHCEIVFSVRDTGIGIAQDDIHSVFNPFFQVDSFLTRRQGGSGLGLAICRQLVELMGGRIWVESRLGEGSHFQFLIPFEIEQQPVVDQSPKTQFATTAPAKLRGRRVLVVEDNALNRQVTCETLTDAGMIVDVASNGQHALEIIRKYRPDVVLMDIQMPIMDGLEASRQIRKIPGHEHLPIIIMTAHATLKGQLEQKNPIFNDYLTKPVEPTALYSSLLRHLSVLNDTSAIPDYKTTQVILPNQVDLAGIDIQLALKMTNGNIDRLKKRICQFVDDIHNLDEQLGRCQSQSRKNEIYALIHNLKGASGSIGASSLHELASAFLKTNDDPSQCVLLEKIIDEIRLLKTTAQVVRNTIHPSTTTRQHVAAISQDWSTLGELIDGNQYVPEDLLDRLEVSLSDSGEIAIMHELRHELARFRYAAAGSLFKKLCNVKAIYDAS